MSAKTYTVSDLVAIEQQYSAAWKAANCEQELPEPPNFSDCQFDPRGLVNSLSEVENELAWLKDFLTSCLPGKFRRFAVAAFDLPSHACRPANEQFGRTLMFSHKELGDINIDIIYRNSTIEFEFVWLL